MRHKSYREESRNNWGTKQTATLNHEQIQTGCLLRIADATEVIAKEHQRLIESAKYQKTKADRLQRELDTARRSNAALRGHIKRMKKVKS